MKRIALVFLAVAALDGRAGYAAPPDGEEVMDQLSKVLRQMQDVTADVEVHTQQRQASGNIVLGYVKAPAKAPGQDERTVRKYIVVTRVKTRQGLATIKKLNDGEYLWTEVKIAATGRVTVSRHKVQGEGPVPGGFGPDWRREIDVWREKFTFRTLRTDTFDKEPVAVVEGTRKETGEDNDAKQHPEMSLPDRMVLFISTRDYFPRKVELYSSKQQTPQGERKQTLTVSVRLMRVKLNEGLKPDTFRYTVPPGAEFVDVK